MADVLITRKQIIVVGEVSKNTYGDLVFTDKEGKSYKVGAKRIQYVEKDIVPGQAVQLNFATYKGKEYVYNTTSIKEGLDQVPKPTPQAPQSKSSPVPVASGSKPLGIKDEQIERAVWIKELGLCLREKSIDKTTPLGKAFNNAYYTEMSRVLGISIQEVKPTKSKLVEEAKSWVLKKI